MPPTAIKSVEISPLDLPLHAPFGISGGVQPAANNVLVELTLADGTVGYGEGAPLPPYNGDTQAQAIADLTAARVRLPRRDAVDWRGLASDFRTHAEHRSGAAQAALEMALLDAVTRHRGVPLTRFFGGANAPLEIDMTITTGTVEEAANAARDIRRRGIRWIKVKVGGAAGVAHDVARLEAVREIAPDAPLILDANAGLTRATAGELARAIRVRGIVPALLEQWLPKDDLEGMRALGAETGWRIVADESVANPLDALRVARTGAAQVINVKLMKAGIAAAWDVVGIAREFGLELMIGGNVESILGMTAAACFAAGIGGFKYADLDTPLFIAANPFAGGYELDGGTISVAGIAAGHGVVPRR